MEALKEINATGFAGCDMMLTLGDKQIAELQAVSAKEFRDMAPIYTIGNEPEVRHRGVKGSLLIACIYDKEACESDHKKTIEIRYYSEIYNGYLSVYITEIDLLCDLVTTELALQFTGKEILKGEIKEDGLKRE